MDNETIYVPVLESLQNFNLIDNVPLIQFAPKQIELDVSSFINPTAFLDSKGYSSHLTTEMEMISKIESFVEIGNDFVHFMYTYRSISKALPEISIDLPSHLSPEEKAENLTKRNEINRKVVEILRPEMLKIRDLMNFVLEATHCFRDCVLHLTQVEIQKEVIPEGLHVAMIKLLDVLVKLDNLKDMKSSLRSDFSRYKRAIGSQLSSDALEEQNQLQQFLSNPDSKKSKNYIFVSLREEIKRMVNHEAVLLDLLLHSALMLESDVTLTPDEKFRTLRVLPHLMLLVDGSPEDPRSVNVFRTYRTELAPVQRLLRQNPVVPLYGDMSITIEVIIRRAAHFEPSLSPLWGGESTFTLSEESSTKQTYSLSSNWAAVRASFEDFSANFTILMNDLSLRPFNKSLSPSNVALGDHVCSTVVQGFRLLSQWSTLIHKMLIWKYSHPCSEEQMRELMGASSSPSSPTSDLGLPSLYERAIRYNMQQDELSTLMDVVSMIKSLSSLMGKAEHQLAPIIRFHIHHSIQQLVQGDLLPVLHKVDKRKNAMLPLLLQIRMSTADWKGGVEPREDYKAYSSKQGEVTADHVPRVVGASPSQLQILRAQVRSLYDQRSSLRKGTLFRGSELSKETIDQLTSFYEQSALYPYLLNYSGTLHSVSDLGDLWFREFYLDITKCIQFPIDTSIPWLLTEHVISQKRTSDAPMIENLLFSMDIYNDAAHRALFVLKQQHLYDEIQAEVNLVFDQLIYLLSDEIFSHYKDLAASSLLETTYKHRLEEILSKSFDVSSHRYEIPMSQRHVQLLGRSIDLCFLIGQHVNNKIHSDIDVAIRRFESGDLTGIVDLRTALSIIQRTHEYLSPHLQLDDFDVLMNEVNESFSPTCFQNRISFQLLKSIVADLCPNFSYNTFTQRFVKAPVTMKPVDFAKAPKQAAISQTYGSLCFRAFEAYGKLSRGFVGRTHLEAIANLLEYSDLFMIVEECSKNLLDKMQGLNAYVEALQESIPPLQMPKLMFGSVGGFGYFEGKLKSLLEYDDLKPEVFQSLREIGNTIAFFRDLSQVLSIHDSFSFVNLSPFSGLTPNTPSPSPTPAKPTASSSPLGSILANLSSPVSETNKPNKSPSINILDHLYTDTTLTDLPEIGDRLLHNLAQPLQTSGSRNLFKGVISKVENYMYQLNLFHEWGRGKLNRSQQSYFLCQDSEKSFHRLWSALCFLYCLQNPEVEVDEPEDGEEKPEDGPPNTDEQQYGHGFSFAGCLFVHLLDQRPGFELSDFSNHVLRVYEHELSSVQPRPKGLAVDPSLQADTDKFIEAAIEQRKLQDELFSLFEAQHPKKMSSEGRLPRTFLPVEPPSFS